MVLGIAMDFQKNMSFPNIFTNDVYYRRQLSMYLFNIHSFRDNDAVFYCYPEVNGKKGSNEVAEFLFHFITNYADNTSLNLHIFCDSAGGQIKIIPLLDFYVMWFFKLKSFNPLLLHSQYEGILI